MCSNDEAKELAALLDSLCAGGSGHINVAAGEGGELSAFTANSTECCGGNMACAVPTLHKGIDEEGD